MSVESANPEVGGNNNPADNTLVHPGVPFDSQKAQELASWDGYKNPSVSGDQKPSSSVKNAIKIIVTFAITALLVVAIIVGGFYFLREEQRKTNDEISQSFGRSYQDVAAIRERYSANSDAYYDAMQQLIDAEKHSETKARLLLYRAEDLSKYESGALLYKAADDAYKSEELYPTIDSAYWISEIETKRGNQAAADKYSSIKEQRVEANGNNEGEG